MPDQNDINKSPKNYKVWEPLLLALMVVLGMFIGQKMTKSTNDPLIGKGYESSNNGKRLEELIHFIEERYVDDVDSEALVDKAIEAVLEELDPHSSYLPPTLTKELEKKMQGKFEGIGIEFFTQKDSIILAYIMKDGPAEKSKLQVGDRILSANDTILSGPDVSKEKIYKILKDKKGTKAALKIFRPGSGILGVDIVRDEIPIKSIAAYEMMDKSTGYIKIDRFSSTTYKEFMDAIEYLVDQKQMQHLVIDLRKNPGGYMQQAVNMLSQLFDERNKLLLYTKGEKSKRTEYKTTGNQFFKIDKVAVLIDENSASASEIMAGAIQDHDRGIIVGESSFGKALVQENYPLSDGASLRLTIARYYTPSGRLIQRPYDSHIDPGHEAYYEHIDTTQNLDTTHYYTNKGRVVYSQGGVTPDILIPSLIDFSDPVFKNLYHYLTAFATDQIIKLNRDYQTIDAYNSYLDTVDLQGKFLAYAANNDFENPLNITPKVANEISLNEICRASIISHRFGYAEWYNILNDIDPVSQKALEIINSESLYSEQLK